MGGCPICSGSAAMADSLHGPCVILGENGVTRYRNRVSVWSVSPEPYRFRKGSARVRLHDHLLQVGFQVAGPTFDVPNVWISIFVKATGDVFKVEIKTIDVARWRTSTAGVEIAGKREVRM